MNTSLTPATRPVSSVTYAHPTVTVIMPFNPKMILKNQLEQSLKVATGKVEEQILQHYPDEMGLLVIQKLLKVISELNFSTNHNSIAIYISPVFEKVLYLDMEVTQQLLVGQSFTIRSAVQSKVQVKKYLLLSLGQHTSSIYVGTSENLVRIVSDAATPPPKKLDGLPMQKPAHQQDFLKHINNSLGFILATYNLPLFVAGAPHLIKAFKAVTLHAPAIIQSIEGNFENATIEKLCVAMQLPLDNWEAVLQKNILAKIKTAEGKNKIACGLKAVWQQAMSRRGKLLIAEQNYLYHEACQTCDELIHTAITPHNKFSYLHNAVDEIIEKVLENGGGVEFVEDGFLKDYQALVLIND